MTSGILGISGDEYWTDASSAASAVIERLGEAGTPTLTLDAPPLVSVDGRSELPVHFVYVRSLAEAQQLDPEQALVLVAVRLEDNLCLAQLALFVDKEPAVAPMVSTDPPNVGMTGELLTTDARAQLGVPWERGTLTMTGLLRERISNTCQSVLGPERSDFVDPEVEAYLDAKRASRVPVQQAEVWPALAPIRGAIARTLDGGPPPFPNYRAHADSPPIPDAMGVTLVVERVVESGPGNRCVLRGSFRLPCTVHERVPYDLESGRLFGVGAPGATAVVQIHLVVTAARFAGPIVLPLRIPSFDELASGEDGVATGSFNLDLFEIPAMPQVPDTYFLTAFSREVVTGPIPLGIAPSTAG